jgi:hypothetical protein
MNQQTIFHLAIPIDNILKAKEFYRDGLGCKAGRETKGAIIFDFYGHQVVAHVTNEPLQQQQGVYPRHFGLVLPTKSDWDAIATKAQTQELTFYEQPKLRFPQKLIEHYTFFLEDPFHNLLEFKYYSHTEAIFDGRELSKIGDRSE